MASTGTAGYSGDDGLATSARLNSPPDVALDGRGNLYIADYNNHRVRKVDATTGVITTVVGTGTQGYNGDNRPATTAQLNNPAGVAVDPWGNLYIADYNNHRVRKVSPDGVIMTVAGTRNFGISGDEGLATMAAINRPSEVAVDGEGNLFIVDWYTDRIRKVSVDGILSTVAGAGQHGFSGDGGPATAARLGDPADVAVDREGTLYIVDVANQRLRRVTADGIITTLAGTGSGGYNGDGGPASVASLNFLSAVAVTKDGKVVLSDQNNHRVRQLQPHLPGLSGQEIVIPSEAGDELYVFNEQGRHLRTLEARSLGIRHELSYNSQGLLEAVTDGSGNRTTIERDAAGRPTAIASPYGQHTTLGLDSHGRLATLTNPGGEQYQFETTPEGLLTAMKMPEGQRWEFAYDSAGRLVRDTDAAGGGKTLNRTEMTTGFTVAVRTAEGRTTTYDVEELLNGVKERRTQRPDGTILERQLGTQGREVITWPEGRVLEIVEGPDPRFGMQVPIMTSLAVTTPGGRRLSQSGTRSVTLADTANSLSLLTQTDTTIRNGRQYTHVYTATTRTQAITTPAGRRSTTILDALGRVAQSQLSGLALIQFSYDSLGRLNLLDQGGRTSTFAYDANGYLASLTDPLGRLTSFARDAVGRVTTQTLPDGREITFTYDANSNVTSITPPGRPAHQFTYTPVNLENEYLPPNPQPPIPSPQTVYAYNLDRQLTSITRPDGQGLFLNYNSGGRLSSQVAPNGQYTYSYDGAGWLASVTAPTGETLTYSYDGSLLMDTIWAGTVSGSVNRSYDNDFRLSSQSVNGGNTISFTYDQDSLLTGAVALTLSRDAQHGLLTGTTLGAVSDTYSYALQSRSLLCTSCPGYSQDVVMQDRSSPAHLLMLSPDSLEEMR